MVPKNRPHALGCASTKHGQELVQGPRLNPEGRRRGRSWDP
ncbi:MAG: hypothetical protein AVDCRST_MAG73-1576 [uncultured Thermomicrobiales bacterium]|uniref:Uncharacterized protein n=1 Tax=uncultured Thermomicrobiales bacterium TaxID=1645740 RepID=A0A6J4U1M2_9BACT|nr:MAG: hypothetical protein AVDCRST_MAG73-1576 [uncultured Thermomicrobiales bacterium]